MGMTTILLGLGLAHRLKEVISLVTTCATLMINIVRITTISPQCEAVGDIQGVRCTAAIVIAVVLAEIDEGNAFAALAALVGEILGISAEEFKGIAV